MRKLRSLIVGVDSGNEVLFEEAGRQDLIEETLRLGVTELVACTWLQDFLRLIKEAYPKLRNSIGSRPVERN